MKAATEVVVRAVRAADAPALGAIDAAFTGRRQDEWWRQVVARHAGGGKGRVGLVAVEGSRVVGYLLGVVRELEFGSSACGWIFAVGVHPDRLRSGVATHLFRASCERFSALGVDLVRTLVRRDDVPTLTFFRNQGCIGGPYVELELALRPAGRGAA